MGAIFDIFAKNLVMVGSVPKSGFSCEAPADSGKQISNSGLVSFSQEDEISDKDWYVVHKGDLTDGKNVACKSGWIGGFYDQVTDQTYISIGSSFVIGELKYGVRVYE